MVIPFLCLMATESNRRAISSPECTCETDRCKFASWMVQELGGAGLSSQNNYILCLQPSYGFMLVMT